MPSRVACFRRNVPEHKVGEKTRNDERNPILNRKGHPTPQTQISLTADHNCCEQAITRFEQQSGILSEIEILRQKRSKTSLRRHVHGRCNLCRLFVWGTIAKPWDGSKTKLGSPLQGRS